jgi:hypothetical protein
MGVPDTRGGLAHWRLYQNGNTGDLVPRLEGLDPSGSILVSGKAIAAFPRLCKLSGKRKYGQTAWLMISAGKR